MPELTNVTSVLSYVLKNEAMDLPEDLVLRIYKMEEKVQYDGQRSDIVPEIRRIVQAAVEEGILTDRWAL